MKKKKIKKSFQKKSLISFSFGGKIYQELIEGNIELSELTPKEVKKAINRAVGKYAFYASLRADAKAVESRITADFELWKAERYSVIESDSDFMKKKPTETTKKYRMLLDNQESYKAYQNKLIRISKTIAKLYVLVDTFDMMGRVLQSVLAMQRTEMDSIGKSKSMEGED